MCTYNFFFFYTYHIQFFFIHILLPSPNIFISLNTLRTTSLRMEKCLHSPPHFYPSQAFPAPKRDETKTKHPWFNPKPPLVIPSHTVLNWTWLWWATYYLGGMGVWSWVSGLWVAKVDTLEGLGFFESSNQFKAGSWARLNQNSLKPIPIIRSGLKSNATTPFPGPNTFSKLLTT